MTQPLMKCGHTALSHDEKGNQCCPICFGISPGATEVVEEVPDLTGRVAVCDYCGKERPSSLKLPFFEYHKDKEKDDFYCGCRGWD